MFMAGFGVGTNAFSDLNRADGVETTDHNKYCRSVFVKIYIGLFPGGFPETYKLQTPRF